MLGSSTEIHLPQHGQPASDNETYSPLSLCTLLALAAQILAGALCAYLFLTLPCLLYAALTLLVYYGHFPFFYFLWCIHLLCIDNDIFFAVK